MSEIRNSNFASAFADVLDMRHRNALHEQALVLIDQSFDEFVQSFDIESGDFDPDDVTLLWALPRSQRLRYTRLFAKEFFLCFSTVVWKLAQPAWIPLACVAEELALGILVDFAAGHLKDEQGIDPEFEGFYDRAFEDLDFELLYQASEDGVQESIRGNLMGMGHLEFREWFLPFSGRAVHPYSAETNGDA